MNEMRIESVNEVLYSETLENGLRVFVLPKPEFNKTFATFTTNYGSIDHRFVPLGKNEFLHVPDGIAHFLEHKMFEKEDGDVFQKFGLQGAAANAFTSFTRTAYLFSSTSQVELNLETLLDFVQKPWFSDQSVEKEKGIIAQEIQMYQDNADWRLYFGGIGSMYQSHPVKLDIAGTVDSIGRITKELLYECYNTFYHPSNMILFVIGPVNHEEIIEFVKNNQAVKKFDPPSPIVREYEQEGGEAANNHVEITMPVQTPKVMVGIKLDAKNEMEKGWLKNELIKGLLLQYLFGEQSENYYQLYQEGLVDDSFSFDYTEERSFGFGLVGGDTPDPVKLRERIIHVLLGAKNVNFQEDQLNLLIKKKIGSFLMGLNSQEFIANQFTRYAFYDSNLFDVYSELQNITVKDLSTVASNWIKENSISTFTILPK